MRIGYSGNKQLLLGALCAATAFMSPSANAQAFGFDDFTVVRDGATELDQDHEKPRMVARGDFALLTWETKKSDGKWHILFSRTTDGGETWSAPLTIASNTKSKPRPKAAIGGSEYLICYSDGNANGGDMKALHSANFESASTAADIVWSLSTVFADPIAGLAQLDGEPAGDEVGNFVVIWEGEHLDIFSVFSSSSTDGVTWSPPVVVSNWTDAGDVTEDGDCRIAYGDGAFVTTFKSGNSDLTSGPRIDEDVFVSVSTDNGATWSANPIPVHDWSETDVSDDDNPHIQFGAGKFMVVWNSAVDIDGTGNDGDIMASIASSSDLTAWTTSVVNDGINDGGTIDEEPDVSVDGAGNWMVIWASDLYDLNFDVLAATSTDGVTWAQGAGAVGGLNDVEEDEASTAASGNGTFYVAWIWDQINVQVSVTSIVEGTEGDEEITASFDGFVEEGDNISLTAPAGGSNYQWLVNGFPLTDDEPRVTGTTTQTLTFNPVLESDSGVYTVQYEDGAKAIVVSPAFELNVLPPNSLPVAGMLGLGLLSGLVTAIGVTRIRKRAE